MKNFNYINAPDLPSALEALANPDVYLVAGGTNALVDIRAGKINDRTLINIQGLTEFDYITLQENGRIQIGALTGISKLAASDLLAEKAPALYQAARNFADPLTRNSATIGGNLANASPAADTAPPLLALDAELLLASRFGERRLPLREFFLGVGKTALVPGEMVLAVEFMPNSFSSFLKLGLRQAMAISIVTAAAALSLDKEGIVREFRLAFGSVGPTPLRAYNGEKAVTGTEFADPEVIKQLQEAVQLDINPIDDLRAGAGYRREMAGVLAKRAYLAAGREAGQ
ncbi:MAG: xanthine dehydrogenase family protein subunit M [Clostridiales bacterium]|nr:xanthine dehydrogenase family protein subunit M [Clostridiales bacterium]